MQPLPSYDAYRYNPSNDCSLTFVFNPILRKKVVELHQNKKYQDLLLEAQKIREPVAYAESNIEAIQDFYLKLAIKFNYWAYNGVDGILNTRGNVSDFMKNAGDHYVNSVIQQGWVYTANYPRDIKENIVRIAKLLDKPNSVTLEEYLINEAHKFRIFREINLYTSQIIKTKNKYDTSNNLYSNGLEDYYFAAPSFPVLSDPYVSNKFAVPLNQKLTNNTLISNKSLKLNTDLYEKELEDLLLPTLFYLNDSFQKDGKKGIISISQPGSGFFAGDFAGQEFSDFISTSIRNIFSKYYSKLNNIAGVINCEFTKANPSPKVESIGHIKYKSLHGGCGSVAEFDCMLSANRYAQLLDLMDTNLVVARIVGGDYLSYIGNEGRLWCNGSDEARCYVPLLKSDSNLNINTDIQKIVDIYDVSKPQDNQINGTKVEEKINQPQQKTPLNNLSLSQLKQPTNKKPEQSTQKQTNAIQSSQKLLLNQPQQKTSIQYKSRLSVVIKKIKKILQKIAQIIFTREAKLSSSLEKVTTRVFGTMPKKTKLKSSHRIISKIKEFKNSSRECP